MEPVEQETKRGRGREKGCKPGPGRPKGSKNKVAAELKATIAQLCEPHVSTAIKTLVDIAQNGETETARVAASNSILDRVYGKARQDVGVNVSVSIVDALDVIAARRAALIEQETAH